MALFNRGSRPTQAQQELANAVASNEYRAGYVSTLDDASTCAACRSAEALGDMPIDDPRLLRFAGGVPTCTSSEGCRCVVVLIHRSEQ